MNLDTPPNYEVILSLLNRVCNRLNVKNGLLILPCSLLYFIGICNAQIVTTVAGVKKTLGCAEGNIYNAVFGDPVGICVDRLNNIYVLDGGCIRLVKIEPGGLVYTIAGGASGNIDGPALQAAFSDPKHICIDGLGNIYIADRINSTIRKLNTSAIVSTLAGKTRGFADGIGASAKFHFPYGVCVDSSGNIYVTDRENAKIRKITPTGVVSTLAGSTPGFADGTGSAAKFFALSGICLDPKGNLFVADFGNHKIRKITPSGVVTTLAGSTSGFADGIGTNAQFSNPSGVCSDDSGNIYVADFNNHCIRKVSPSGVVTTVAGNGLGFGYVDGPGSLAKFKGPVAICINASGDLYVADQGNENIRKITTRLTFKTEKQLCSGDSLLLSSGYTGTAYLWSTGDTSRSIVVKDSGNYWVRTTIKSNWDITDTFSIKVQQQPIPFTSTDTTFCIGDSITLNVSNPMYSSYLWNTGSKNASLTINTTGLYTVTLDNKVCRITDSINITMVNLLPFKTDTSYCEGQHINLTSGKAHTYKWNSTDTTQTITVNTPGIYFVTKSQTGCNAIDSFVVSAIEQPSSATLDTSFCVAHSIILSAGSAKNYSWNTGESAQSIKVDRSGLYFVLLSNKYCRGVDSFWVTEKPFPIITGLKDTTVCFDEISQILLDAGKFKSYLWRPTGETTRTIYSSFAQVYLLTVTDTNNCSTSQQVAVMETCPEYVFIPTAFTPNNDGLNDVFLPKVYGIETYEMRIINRWGEIVFSTQNTLQGWDGKDAVSGVYIAQVSYSAAGKTRKTVSQNFTLLK